LRIRNWKLDPDEKTAYLDSGRAIWLLCAKSVDDPPPFQALLQGPQPVLALAPMQDVTDRPFMALMTRYGGADVYFTEYFRVHQDSRLEKGILESITRNPTGRPVVAQMIGNHVSELVRTANELQRYPVAAIDLNLGCPAPVVYKKCAGGGLLREPERVDAILGALRDAVRIPLTVKTRLGFESAHLFDEFLAIFARHSIDLLTVHGRTVMGGYRSAVDYEWIARAVAQMKCPVLANGNIDSAQKAEEVLAQTGARGLMIGRGAIRNPWLFNQIRQKRSGAGITLPTGQEVLAYVRDLYEAVCAPEVRESSQVQKIKKYLNFMGLGVEPTGRFLHEMRRTETKEDLFKICASYLDHSNPMPLEPMDIPLNPKDVLAVDPH
jgi:tRNA-dihydrouridine synthase B